MLKICIYLCLLFEVLYIMKKKGPQAFQIKNLYKPRVRTRDFFEECYNTNVFILLS